VLQNYKAVGLLIILIAAFPFVATSPVLAAVTGYVTRAADGIYYQYQYDELLDSYALKVLGQSNGLYEDYASKEVYALKDSLKGYIVYKDVLDRYAEALAGGEQFDLNDYTESGRAQKAELPFEIKLAGLNEGRVVYSKLSTVSNNNPPPGFELPAIQTPIVGAPEVTVETAQKWAIEQDAHQRLIGIAPIYWSYGEKTGIRPELLYAQAAYKTDFGHYSGGMPPEYNNWSGISTAYTDDDERGQYEEFADPEQGVRAHFNHISAYIGLKPIGEPHARYQVAASQPWAGAVINLEDLSGKWVSDENYHLQILYLLDQMVSMEIETKPDSNEPEESKPDQKDFAEAKKIAVDVSEVTVLHLRSGPSTDHDILDRLVRGTVLQVVGKEGVWFKAITPQGQEGWVHGDYVKALDLADSPFKEKKVVIDPGHGGVDSGAVGVTGLKEKDLTLEVGERLKKMLEDAGAVVIMTRSGDHSVSSANRVKIANEVKADVYVSIHANAHIDPDSNGTETFYCSENSYRDASKYLAQQLHRELIYELGLRDRGVKTECFYMLKKTKMPSTLVEIAFLTNEKEEELLRKPETRARVAEALFRGLEAYLRKHQ